MTEADDRLVGDPVWELFPARLPKRRAHLWAEAIVVTAVAWLLYPPAGVLVACFEASFRDFRSGHRMARAIPDRMGSRISALFAYAWAAWKVGAAGFAMIFVTLALTSLLQGKDGDFNTPIMTAILLWAGSFFAAAVLTALGLVQAYRSGMRVWVGQGINQARTLLLGMLLVGFVCLVLIPIMLLLVGMVPTAGDGRKGVAALLLGEVFLLFGAPVILLVILDRFTRLVVAEQPAKFGPKVPAVGKWS